MSGANYGTSGQVLTSQGSGSAATWTTISAGSTANVRTGILDVAGIATFRSNTLVGSGITLSPDGDGFYTGIVTATSFAGDGSALTNLPAGSSDSISEGNTKAEVEDTGSTGRFLLKLREQRDLV